MSHNLNEKKRENKVAVAVAKMVVERTIANSALRKGNYVIQEPLRGRHQ